VTIRLFGAFAHPDDDVYQLGGTLALDPRRFETTFVFATSGDAGPITEGSGATRETLADVREGEQAAALAAIGTGERARARFLRHPDYHLPDVPLDRLAAELEAAMREVAPHVVVTFGPDGLTSHHDHIRVGEACTRAFHAARATARPGTFARLLHTAIPRSDVDRFYAGLAGLEDRTYGAEGDLFNLVGVPDERIDEQIDVGPVVRTKLAGILAHATQVCEWERIPAPLRWIHLEHESFVQAWPPPQTEPAEPRLSGTRMTERHSGVK
jgi:LmbE family N-acetylglucosaminyl deacetylase